jgi:hypothetical protein
MIWVLLLASVTAHASESDQYFAWGRPIADSAELLNGHVNGAFERVLAKVNEDADRSLRCVDVASRIRKKLAMDALLMEFFPHRAVELPRMPQTEADFREYDRISYYGFPQGIGNLTLWIPASPTVEADGIRYGLDKLQHFFSTGWRCFERYWKARRKGRSRDEAYGEAMDYAIATERSNLGLKTSRVFSYADMHANFQGVRFYAGLCEGGPNAALRTDGAGRWALLKPFDIREYLSPDWDESFNPSWFVASRWRYTAPRLPVYCPKLKSPFVLEQRERYRRLQEERNRDPDFVTRYLRGLLAAGKVPDPWPHSLERACGLSVESFTGLTPAGR